jgi:hypothetical protein
MKQEDGSGGNRQASLEALSLLMFELGSDMEYHGGFGAEAYWGRKLMEQAHIFQEKSRTLYDDRK